MLKLENPQVVAEVVLFHSHAMSRVEGATVTVSAPLLTIVAMTFHVHAVSVVLLLASRSKLNFAGYEDDVGGLIIFLQSLACHNFYCGLLSNPE